MTNFRIQELNESIQKKESKKETSEGLVFDMLKTMETRLEEEARQQQLKHEAEKSGGADRKDEKKDGSDKSVSAEWCDDEIKLLVKGLKIIPVGTRERWELC